MSHLRIQSLAAAIMVAAYLFSAATASAGPQDVPGSGNDPKLDMCWSKAWAFDESGERVWKTVFSQCLGMSQAELSLDGPSPRLVARCDAKAELDYTLAELVGVDADAAYEDSYSACVNGAQ